MSLFDRTRYLRAIFILLPFSVLAIFFGLKGQHNLPKWDDLMEVKGVVMEVREKKEYSENYKMFVDRRKLFLIDHAQGYIFNKQKDYEIFMENFSQGDSVTIWLNNKTKPIAIRQFANKEETLLKYSRIDFSYIIFIFFGIVILVVSLLYIFKHPEDLSGGSKRA